MKKSHKDKPLPKPPTTAFGGKKRFEQEDETTLLADRMAAAIAEGTIGDFLKQEMPDNEYARNLATMMMGMTGMMPAGSDAVLSQTPENNERPLSSDHATSGQIPPAEEIPEDIKEAIRAGDVRGLMDHLRREHQKRRPGAEATLTEEDTASQAVDQPTIDKELIDALIRIAADNSVTLDWIILRAIKLYVQEYLKTGRL